MSSSNELSQWGRVLITGGTDWANLGRKAAGGQKVFNEDAPDLPMPHILRPVSNIKMTRVFSSHSSSHSVFLALDGDAWVYGRNERGQCGLNTSGKPLDEPVRLDRTKHFKPALPKGPDGAIAHVATGRSHTLLCTKGGAVYAAGLNTNGQCGNEKLGEVDGFTRIEGAAFTKEKDPVVQVGAGITFSLMSTASGKVYAIGSTEKGQLGNGKTGEHFISGNKMAFHTHTEPLLVKALADKKITQIACGQQHSIALTDDGYVYVWGFGGYGRLGLGAQHDALTPTLVPQFARDNELTRAKAVYAGPACSAVIDRQAMYYLAGKWKTSGDGGSGQGFMTFKYLHDLMGCKVLNASLGGVTLLVTAVEQEAVLRGHHEATMNVVWGQSANNGELGLGINKPRSATKPIRCETLDGIAVLDCAAGQNSCFYIARNMGPTYSELPRFPETVPSQDVCVECGLEASAKGADDALLECEKCENPTHLGCCRPALAAIPEGEWHCNACIAAAQENLNDDASPSGSAAALPKGKRELEADDADDTPKKRGKVTKKK